MAVAAGFTLIELAVVVFVMALILGSILIPLSTQVEQRQVADATQQLELIKDALIGFATANGRLPCPDRATGSSGVGVANDGQEDSPTTPCANVEGNVPWATLGLGAVDPWGNRYRYRVTQEFASSTSLPTLATLGNIQICESYDSAFSCVNALTIAPSNAVAMILSHGPNGWGAISAATNAIVLPAGCSDVPSCDPALLGRDEKENAEGTNPAFASRPPSGSAHPSGEFDDIVIWISPHVLKSRMIAAGMLP